MQRLLRYRPQAGCWLLLSWTLQSTSLLSVTQTSGSCGFATLCADLPSLRSGCQSFPTFWLARNLIFSFSRVVAWLRDCSGTRILLRRFKTCFSSCSTNSTSCQMDAPTTSTSAPSASRLSKSFQTRLQYYLDKSTPHSTWRWLGLLAFILIYAIRVYFLRGFYIVTYALGIYNLNLLLGFLSPQVDPELEGPALPSRTTDEYRPFIRRLPEFKFW